MKKAIICLTIFIIMIVCTCCAGCVSTPSNVDETPSTIPSATTSLENNVEKEFNSYMNLIDNPVNYEIQKGNLLSYVMARPGINWFQVGFDNPERTDSIIFAFTSILNSDNMFKFSSGVKLDEEKTKVFLVKDTSITVSYVVGFVPDGRSSPEASIMFLTPSDYDKVIKTIQNWFEEI